MLFRARRSYRIRNLFINRDIICSSEKRYGVHKKPSNNIYLIRKNNKIKKLKLF